MARKKKVEQYTKPVIRRVPADEILMPSKSETSDSVPVVATMQSTGRVVEPQYGMSSLRSRTGTALNVHNAVMVANGKGPSDRMTVDDYKKMVRQWLAATA